MRITIKRRWVLAVAALATTGAGPVHAQVVLDGTLGPAGALTGPTIFVPPEAGQLRGNNLFHSFSEFNVAQGELVGFTGPANVQNVLARVTGGNPSTIDGTIGTTIAGANLFLINPRGITFGPNSQVLVDGAFVATTADFVRFRDGGRFDATTPAQTTLTSAPPEAYGFLSGMGGAATVATDEAFVFAGEGRSLTFAGGAVTISGGIVQAASGRVNVAAVRAGELRVDPTNVAVLDASGITERGPVSVASTFVSADGDGTTTGAGGDVTVIAQDANFGPAAQIGSNTADATDGGGVTIDLTGVLTVSGGSGVTTSTAGAGASGDLVVNAAEVHVVGDVADQTTALTTFSFGSGRSGDTRITADNVFVTADQPAAASISTAAGIGTGTSGDLVINAGHIVVNGTGASLRTTSVDQTDGSGGDITLVADTVEVLGGAQVVAQSRGNGTSGRIDLTANDLLLVSGTVNVPDPSDPDADPIPFRSAVSTTTVLSTATAGGIRIMGGRVRVEQGGSVDTLTNDIDAASIDIQADVLELDTDGRVQADTAGAGAGGRIGIDVRQLNLNNGAFISSSSSGSGAGGTITVVASERVRMDNNSRIATNAIDGPAVSGNLSITAPDVQLFGGALLSTGTINAGDGGQLTVTADRILFSGPISGISSPTIVTEPDARSGAGGQVLLTASESIILEGGARVSTIAGTAETLIPTPGTNTTGLTGAAGNATLVAPLVRITGSGRVDDASPVRPSRVTTSTNLQTPGAAAGGNVLITAGRLEVTDGGLLVADTLGSGRGGNVVVVADNVVLDRGTLSAASTFLGDVSQGLTPGVSGSVNVSASRSLVLRNNSAVTVASAGTDAGVVALTAVNRVRLTDSRIATSANGAGGNITIGGRDLASGAINPLFVILNRSEINANAVQGAGGNISILSRRFVSSADTLITATSEQSDPGQVDVSAGITDLAGSLVRLPGALSNDSARLLEQCGLRIGGDTSSFITTGRGGAPLTPGGLQPSFDLPARK